MKQRPLQFVNDFIVRFYPRLCHAICGLAALTLLSACSPSPATLAPLVDYQDRVANTLEREPVPYQSIEVPRIPPVRQLTVAIPRVSISLLDSWRIDKCAAGNLIARRNSALGKLEKGLSRLHTDVLLVKAMEDCVDELRNNGESLADRLAEALEKKKDNLAAEQEHALATDEALRHALRVGANTHAEADQDYFASSMSALSTVLQLLQSDVLKVNTSTEQAVPTRDQIDEAMETLYQSDYLPYLWRSLFELNAYLRRLQPMLDNLVAASGCRPDVTPQRAEVLHTVFTKYFIGEVQPQVASFTEQGYAVNKVLRELNAEINSPALSDYINELIAVSEDLNEATKAHVKPWQDFFAACNFTPGG
ncbi:DUF3080 family protein [Pseudidiomarina sp. 1APP75-32.1]|uniref:DUF3080 family protein n=1 Tax=Pseudidiomarina terrestris TaxID=2820060 RepID=A0AAW7QYR6_9GAMM|nr:MULTISPECIES: DUF3080 family protein [unclassified Pseudidiomarina]MDN7124179.1 DUF3080 family protein [Pseudidiomarina sp. 1APP75-32.1]MDN7128436.1 DUF3080 family protein [Pseudidiomarina sp. 1APR75-15]